MNVAHEKMSGRGLTFLHSELNSATALIPEGRFSSKFPTQKPPRRRYHVDGPLH